jgi:hypothetical protein
MYMLNPLKFKNVVLYEDASLGRVNNSHSQPPAFKTIFTLAQYGTKSGPRILLASH